MLLGLVLHAGVFSGTLDVGPWRLHHSSEFIFWIVALIHFFRMQLFFLLSGFFSSIVAEKIGIKDFEMSLIFKTIYWLVVTPLSWLLRCLGVRFLKLGFDSRLKSYWTRRSNS